MTIHFHPERFGNDFEIFAEVINRGIQEHFLLMMPMDYHKHPSFQTGINDYLKL